MVESVVLRTGCAGWLRGMHHAVGVLAMVSLLSAGAGTGWTAGAVAALLVVHAWTARRMAPARNRGRLHLAEDGGALLFRTDGVRSLRMLPSGWVGGLLCVVPFADAESGRRLRCVVCRSMNREDAYRRLLLHLRMHPQTVSAGGAAES